MFGGFGTTELLVVLAIVLLIFGPKRLAGLGSELGGAIRGFRSGVREEHEPGAVVGDPESVVAAKAVTADGKAHV